MKNISVETFTNCPETLKFAKVFTRESFHPRMIPAITDCFNTRTYSKVGVIKESDPENIKFRMAVRRFIHVSACNIQTFVLNIGDSAPMPREISTPQVSGKYMRIRV